MAGDNLNKVAQISVTEVELYQIRDGYPLEPRDKLKIYKRGNVTIDGIKLSNKSKKIRITYTELVKLSELRGEGMIDPYPNLKGAAWNKKMDDWKRIGAKSDKKRAKEIRKKMGIESDGEDENEEEEEEEEEESVADMAQDDIAGDEKDEDEDDEIDAAAAAAAAEEEELIPVLDGDIEMDEGEGFESVLRDEFGLGGGEEDNEDAAAAAEELIPVLYGDIELDEGEGFESVLRDEFGLGGGEEDNEDAAAAAEELIPVLYGDIEMDEGEGFESVLRDEVGLGGGEEDNEDDAAQAEDTAATAATAVVGRREGFGFERMAGEVRVEDDPDARRLAEELAKIGAQYPFGGDMWDSPEWWG